MKTLSITKALLGLVFAGAMLAPGAMADQWDHKTILTFNEPVEIPGRVLPAGTYVFRLADSQSDRHIVQILNKRQDKVFATLLTIPYERQRTPEKTIIMFDERAQGAPEAIKEWFYPGGNIGEEFVYPKPKAMELAKANQQPVKTMPAEMAQNITKVETPSPNPAEQPHVAQLKQAPVQVAQPRGGEVEIVEMAQVRIPAAQTLPQTGSEMPMIVLAGLLMLGAAGLARALRSAQE